MPEQPVDFRTYPPNLHSPKRLKDPDMAPGQKENRRRKIKKTVRQYKELLLTMGFMRVTFLFFFLDECAYETEVREKKKKIQTWDTRHVRQACILTF